MNPMEAIQLVMQDAVWAVTSFMSLGTFVWIAGTLVIYQLALLLYQRAGGTPLLHPLILTTAGVGLVIVATGNGVEQYQFDARALHWLLGPATVALALPLYNNWQHVKQQGWRLLVAVGVGGVVAPLLAWLSIAAFDPPTSLTMTMLAKSITTPFAMETVAQIEGVPALVAVFVITTGIVGAVACDIVFRLLNVSDAEAQGLALGTVAHAVGTAKAIQMNETTAAMATVGLCINGIMTAIILPITFG